MEQFADDKDFTKFYENLPNLKLSEEVEELIKRNKYEQDMQQKYAELYTAENKEVLSQQ